IQRSIPKGKQPSVIGEKTPAYMSCEETIERIHGTNPDMRLIVCLRHPIARAYSRYQDILRDEPEQLNGESFEEHITRALEKGYHLTRLGEYYHQLRWIYARFPRDQVAIVIQERMMRQKQQEMDRLFQWLGVPSKELTFRNKHT